MSTPIEDAGIVREPDKAQQQAFVGKVKDADKADRTITHLITTEAVDLYQEVILAKGIDLKNYNNNRVVLWCHDRKMPAVGKNLWIKKAPKRKGLLACTQFADTELGLDLWKLYEGEYLRAWSVGLWPDWGSITPPTAEEIQAEPTWKKARSIVRKSELFEYSACNVPANPDVCNDADLVGKLLGMLDNPEAMTKALGWDFEPKTKAAPEPQADPKSELPPLIGRSFGQVHQAVLRSLADGSLAKVASREVADAIARLKGRA